MKPSTTSYLLLGAVLLSGIFSVQAETLISDDFHETGDINGRSPKTNLNGGAWFAGRGARHLASNGRSVSVTTAYPQLAVVETGENFFKANPGIYELSMDVTFPTQNGDGPMWIGLGFNNGNTTATSFNTPSNPSGGSPWMLLRASGSCLVFAGRGTDSPLANTSTGFLAGQANKLALVLDTRAETWTLKAYVNDVQIPLGKRGNQVFAFTSNPEIRYIGFSANPGGASENTGSTVVNVDNFRLEKISETDDRAN